MSEKLRKSDVNLQILCDIVFLLWVHESKTINLSSWNILLSSVALIVFVIDLHLANKYRVGITRNDFDKHYWWEQSGSRMTTAQHQEHSSDIVHIKCTVCSIYTRVKNTLLNLSTVARLPQKNSTVWLKSTESSFNSSHDMHILL